VVRGFKSVVREIEMVEREARETGRMFYDAQYAQHQVWPKHDVEILDSGEIPESDWGDAIKPDEEGDDDGDDWSSLPQYAGLERPREYSEAAEEIRTVGNALFKIQDYKAAIIKYSKAISYLEYGKSNIPETER